MAYPVAGFTAGFIVGMTGGERGSLMPPIPVTGFRISPAIAPGIDLLYAAVSKCGGVFFQHRKGNIRRDNS